MRAPLVRRLRGAMGPRVRVYHSDVQVNTGIIHALLSRIEKVVGKQVVRDAIEKASYEPEEYETQEEET